jgi:hypothetical protein
MLGAGTYVYFDKDVVSQDLGTYDNPEVAMKETQKHWQCCRHVNVGIESVICLSNTRIQKLILNNNKYKKK